MTDNFTNSGYRRARVIYLIGSLRNPLVPQLGQKLRALGHEVFDDWHAAGEAADDEWQRYEMERGRHYGDALDGYMAWHTFQFDQAHLDRCDTGVMVMPAGKSCHMELGYLVGQKKETYVLFDREPERWDVMYRFCTKVFFHEQELLSALKA